MSIYFMGSKVERKRKAGYPSATAPAPKKKKLALFLQLTWLIQVREISLCRLSQFLVGVGLVVEVEREVLIRLRLNFSVCFNPVKKPRALARVFFRHCLISFENFVMPRFLGKRSLTTVACNVFHKIVNASKSCGIERNATNHNRNACHFIESTFSQTESRKIFWSSRYFFSVMLPGLRYLQAAPQG